MAAATGPDSTAQCARYRGDRVPWFLLAVLATAVLFAIGILTELEYAKAAPWRSSPVPDSPASAGLHEICPGPGKWANQRWVREPLTGEPGTCESTVGIFPPGWPQLDLLGVQLFGPGWWLASHPAEQEANLEAKARARNARVLLLGDSTMIRLWGQLCDAWPTGRYKLMYEEEYFNYLDPRRKALDARGCCWRDYLRIEQPVARPHPSTPGLSQADVAQLPTNITNPMGHGKEADRRVCPTHGLDVEVMAMPLCTDTTRQAAIAAHRAANAYDMIIVNCGLWESGANNATENGYQPRLAKHVELYLSQLAPITKALVWVTTSAVLGLREFPQETGQIQKENDAIVAMLRAKAARTAGLGTELFFLDAFKMSHRADMHEDNVHLSTPYYKHLAGLVTRLVQKQKLKDQGGPGPGS